ncbi:MAG: hypothetical protein PHE49_11100 [bacterium]|nr:hypothetical protein [bacterium]
MKNKNLKLLVVVFLAAVTVFSGCKKSTTTGSTDDTNTAAMILGFLSGDADTQILLISDPIADTAQSQAKINNRVLPWEGIAPGYLAFIDTMPTIPATNYTIKVTSNLDSSTGSITIPETTAITAPAPLDGDTLPLGQAVTCSWTAAQGAQYYDVQYGAQLYDSTGNDIADLPNRQLYSTTTGITIPSYYFIVPGVAYYRVHLEVTPYSGVMPQIGQAGNMTGTIKGFLIGENRYSYLVFYVGTPVKGKSKGSFSDRKSSRKDRINKYLRNLGVNTVVE